MRRRFFLTSLAGLVLKSLRDALPTSPQCLLAYAALGCCGASVAAPAEMGTVLESVEPLSALVKQGAGLFQPVRLKFHHVGQAETALVRVGDLQPISVNLTNISQTVEALLPAVSQSIELSVAVSINGQSLAERKFTLKPVRRLTIYVLPHSHTDIGYTEIQTAIERKQVKNLVDGMEAARRTADYPEGARFVWNVEVLWAADLYLRDADEKARAQFIGEVRSGQVGLNGMYLNELTGLCRPEELLQLFRFSTILSEECGLPVDSAMISDVPGYTWGTVTAMAQAGIKYFSVAPNFSDRIGDILVQWENKPFYWVSPSGKEKVLVWIPFKGYAMSHIYQSLSEKFVTEYQEQLEQRKYPYEITYIRWSGHGDNATPDPAICDFVKDWNSKYAFPKFVIATTSRAFRDFEQRYGDQLPRISGDWTPYWEDGAASSAFETGINRASAERLTQADALWAMLNPAGFPAVKFQEAWRDVLLYSEHTWGADISVSHPESQKTKEQWAIKKSYASNGDRLSRELLDRVLTEKADGDGLEVFNTCSWTRDGVAVLSPELSTAGDRLVDQHGRPVLSQRLNSGELAFSVKHADPLASRHYRLLSGMPQAGKNFGSRGSVLDNGLVRVGIDEKTGGIIELRDSGGRHNFVDTTSGQALNGYLFLPGDRVADVQKNGPVKASIKERGPLVTSIVVDSEAPGCNRLIREVRLWADSDYVEIIDTVDKQRAAISTKPPDWPFAQNQGKESVNFAFPFNVPDGVMRCDIPLGMMQPEVNQIPGACKNWVTVGRWVDVANEDCGITWVTLDAPLVEIGALTANLLGSQKDPSVWRKKIERSQKLYSWVMNNHWFTNYRAYQEGPAVFRYALRPYRKSTPAEATRFAIGLSQPLIATRATKHESRAFSRPKVSSDDVVMIGFKPSDDSRGWIVRLFGASGKDSQVRLSWTRPEPAQVWISDTSERPIRRAGSSVKVPAWSVVTLRAQR